MILTLLVLLAGCPAGNGPSFSSWWPLSCFLGPVLWENVQNSYYRPCKIKVRASGRRFQRFYYEKTLVGIVLPLAPCPGEVVPLAEVVYESRLKQGAQDLVHALQGRVIDGPVEPTWHGGSENSWDIHCNGIHISTLPGKDPTSRFFPFLRRCLRPTWVSCVRTRTPFPLDDLSTLKKKSINFSLMFFGKLVLCFFSPSLLFSYSVQISKPKTHTSPSSSMEYGLASFPKDSLTVGSEEDLSIILMAEFFKTCISS